MINREMYNTKYSVRTSTEPNFSIIPKNTFHTVPLIFHK